jgi:hypothetical protein
MPQLALVHLMFWVNRDPTCKITNALAKYSFESLMYGMHKFKGYEKIIKTDSNTCFLVDHHKQYSVEPDLRRNNNMQLQRSKASYFSSI